MKLQAKYVALVLFGDVDLFPVNMHRTSRFNCKTNRNRDSDGNWQSVWRLVHPIKTEFFVCEVVLTQEIATKMISSFWVVEPDFLCLSPTILQLSIRFWLAWIFQTSGSPEIPHKKTCKRIGTNREAECKQYCRATSCNVTEAITTTVCNS